MYSDMLEADEVRPNQINNQTPLKVKVKFEFSQLSLDQCLGSLSSQLGN